MMLKDKFSIIMIEWRQLLAISRIGHETFDGREKQELQKTFDKMNL